MLLSMCSLSRRTTRGGSPPRKHAIGPVSSVRVVESTVESCIPGSEMPSGAKERGACTKYSPGSSFVALNMAEPLFEWFDTLSENPRALSVRPVHLHRARNNDVRI